MGLPAIKILGSYQNLGMNFCNRGCDGMNHLYNQKDTSLVSTVTSVEHRAESHFPPILSSQAQNWESLLVSRFQIPPGEAACHFSDEHAICLALSPRPVRYLHVKAGKTQAGLYGKG